MVAQICEYTKNSETVHFKKDGFYSTWITSQQSCYILKCPKKKGICETSYKF